MTSMTAPPSSIPIRRTALPSWVIGAACIIGAGVVAAATAHDPTQHALWAVAYLVLVCGVAQIVLGAGQARFTGDRVDPRTQVAQLVTWNVGNAAVIAGTIGNWLWLTDVGGVLLVIALASYLWVTRRARRELLVFGYWVVVAIVLVSIPVGLVLAIVLH